MANVHQFQVQQQLFDRQLATYSHPFEWFAEYDINHMLCGYLKHWIRTCIMP